MTDTASSPLTGEMRQALFALHAGLPSSVVADIFGYASAAWIRRQKNSPEGRAYLAALEDGTHAPELVALMRAVARMIVLCEGLLRKPAEASALLGTVATSRALAGAVSETVATVAGADPLHE